MASIAVVSEVATTGQKAALQAVAHRFAPAAGTARRIRFDESRLAMAIGVSVLSGRATRTNFGATPPSTRGDARR